MFGAFELSLNLTELGDFVEISCQPFSAGSGMNGIHGYLWEKLGWKRTHDTWYTWFTGAAQWEHVVFVGVRVGKGGNFDMQRR